MPANGARDGGVTRVNSRMELPSGRHKASLLSALYSRLNLFFIQGSFPPAFRISASIAERV